MTRAPATESPREWNAEVYDETSDYQTLWGLEVLDRMPLAGDETVLDAGCGTGRVTRGLVERVPRGHVIAVDASAAMVEWARAALPQVVDVHQIDLSKLELADPVDAVLSTAVFHWIPDHDNLFRRLHASLRGGGLLAAQCGGEGNIGRFAEALGEVAAKPPFEQFLGAWRGPWNFSSAGAATAALERAGFEAIECWLEPKTVAPERPRDYLETVILGLHLERLPQDMRGAYLDAVLAAAPEPLELDYVRLNIDARRPAGS